MGGGNYGEGNERWGLEREGEGIMGSEGKGKKKLGKNKKSSMGKGLKENHERRELERQRLREGQDLWKGKERS